MNKLKYYRELNKISVRQLELKTGISRSVISAVENGSRKMTLGHAEIFAKVFNVTPEDILGSDAVRNKFVVTASDNKELTYIILEDFIQDLFNHFNIYDDCKENDMHSSILYIVKTLFELPEDKIEEIKNAVKTASAKNDFKED